LLIQLRKKTIILERNELKIEDDDLHSEIVNFAIILKTKDYYE